VTLNNRGVRTEFNIPKPIRVPWLGVDTREFIPIKDVDLLRIPLKLTDNIFVVEVIQNPIPEWTRPGIEMVLGILVLEIDLVTLELIKWLWDENGKFWAQR
jgi:hypothetical protein